MRTLYFILFALCFGPRIAAAQEVKLINSSRQDWSGGIAGRHGSNCSFTIGMYSCKGDPVPDSLWMEGTLIKLGEQNGNVITMRSGDTVRFDIKVGISKDTYADVYYPEQVSNVVKPPRRYTGVALLSYRYNGRQQYFVIDKIMNYLPHVAYP
ncbi:MAG: hypothetical protein JSS82_19725 [Bacteroidetes bacterium]|nr:hypothetical protein [Bacteroidota bacterium]